MGVSGQTTSISGGGNDGDTVSLFLQVLAFQSIGEFDEEEEKVKERKKERTDE